MSLPSPSPSPLPPSSLPSSSTPLSLSLSDPAICRAVSKAFLDGEPIDLSTLRIARDRGISGLGIVGAFTFLAYLALACSALLYGLSHMPNDQLSALDRKHYRVRAATPSHDRVKRALSKCLRIVSDQSMIMGIAMMSVGFAQVNEMSVYHWRLLVYLSWMPCNINLLALGAIGHTWKGRGFVMVWRMFGMVVLAVMLVVAMIPMQTTGFVASTLRLRSGDDKMLLALRSGSMACFAREQELHAEPMVLVSVAFLLVTLGGEIVRMCKKSGTSLGAFGRLYAKLEARMTREGERASVFSVYGYVVVRAYGDVFTSFFGVLGVMAVSISWDTLCVWKTRANHPQEHLKDADWTVGQFMALFICLLPVLAGIEQLSKRAVPASQPSRPLQRNMSQNSSRTFVSGSTRGFDPDSSKAFDFGYEADRQQLHRTTPLGRSAKLQRMSLVIPTADAFENRLYRSYSFGFVEIVMQLGLILEAAVVMYAGSNEKIPSAVLPLRGADLSAFGPWGLKMWIPLLISFFGPPILLAMFMPFSRLYK